MPFRLVTSELVATAPPALTSNGRNVQQQGRARPAQLPAAVADRAQQMSRQNLLTSSIASLRSLRLGTKRQGCLSPKSKNCRAQGGNFVGKINPRHLIIRRSVTSSGRDARPPKQSRRPNPESPLYENRFARLHRQLPGLKEFAAELADWRRGRDPWSLMEPDDWTRLGRYWAHMTEFPNAPCITV